MPKSEIIPVVAPNMGFFEDGKTKFQGPKPPYIRGGNTPTTNACEEACIKFLGKWDGQGEAPYALSTCSGHAANTVVFKTLAGGGLVASKHLFGTTKAYLKGDHPDEVNWADPWDTQSFIDQSTPETTAWFVEAVSNPTGKVPNFIELSEAAKDLGVLVVVEYDVSCGDDKFQRFGICRCHNNVINKTSRRW